MLGKTSPVGVNAAAADRRSRIGHAAVPAGGAL
jgi:hypothetical protein